MTQKAIDLHRISEINKFFGYTEFSIEQHHMKDIK